MGKMVAFLVVMLGVVMGTMNIQMSRLAIDTSENTTDAFSGTMAQNIANSGMEIALSKLTLDHDWQTGWTNRTISEGTNDIVVQRTGRTDITLTSVGRYNGSQHVVKVKAHRDDPSPYLEGAMTIASDDITVKFGGTKAVVDGTNRTLTGSIAGYNDVYGMVVPSTTVATETANSIPDKAANSIRGVGAEPSIAAYQNQVDIVKFMELWKPQAKITISTGKVTGAVTYGSSTAPTIVYAGQNMEFDGDVTGYGILIIEGDAKFKKNFIWNGIVACNGDEVVTDGKATINGAMLITNIVHEEIKHTSSTTADPGLPGGHFDVDVFLASNSRLYHQHAWDDKYGPPLDVLNNPYLLWKRCVGTTQGLTIEFRAADKVSGTYEIIADNFTKSHTGTSFMQGTAKNFTVATGVNNIRAFRIIPDRLSCMTRSNPGTVQKDAANRDGSFTVFVKNSSGKVLWEFPLYWHTSAKDPIPTVITGGTTTTTTTTVPVEYSKVKYELKAESKILYSQQWVDLVLGKLNLMKWKVTSYYE